MLTTKTGVGKYKVIEKKGSNVLEWTVHFMDCGFTAVRIMKMCRVNILFVFLLLGV